MSAGDRLTRWGLYGLGGTIGLLALVVGIVVLLVWRTLPQTEGDFAVPGLAMEADLIRDGYGVPHIFAPTGEAAYSALGVAHAQDRLWQMEVLRRAGQGRLAELFGADFLRADIYLRAKGYETRARAAIEAMPPTVRRALEAYARGVNAVIETGARSPEMLLLGAEPEPWRIADSVLAVFAISENLSPAQGRERALAALARRLPPERLVELIPTMDAAEAARYRALFDGEVAPAGDSAPGTAGRVEAIDLGLGPGTGLIASASNVWASGQGAGRVLANDPHLALQLPQIWYLARLETPHLAVRGATLPGVPFHVSGQSRHMAWGVTVAGADDADYVIERPSADGTAVLRPGGARVPLEERVERIAVKGAEPVSVRLRFSDRGPILSDSHPDVAALAPDGHLVSLDWTAEAPVDRTMTALHALSHARDWEPVRQRLRGVTRPILNVMAIAADGTLGHTIAGAIPHRPGAGDTVCGLVPRPGWESQEGCGEGLMPEARIPRTESGDGMPLYNANQPWPEGTNWRLAALRYPGVRAARIRSLLDAEPAPSVERFAAMQRDTHARDAVDFLAAVLPLVAGGAADADERVRWARERLAAWDFHADREKVAPMLYAAWREMLFRDLIGDETAGRLFPFWEQRAGLVTRLIAAESAFCDDIRTDGQESCAAIARRALGRALDRLEETLGGDRAGWRWEMAHRARLESPFWRRIPVVGDLTAVELGTGGDSYTLNRAAPLYSETLGPDWLADQHGPGYRGVYDLVDPAESRFVLAGGNSGNPFGGHWADQSGLWQRGEAIALDGSAETLLRAGGARLRLMPATQQ